MGDRGAERPGLGPLDVDVDPLVVAGGVGELVDLLLGDLDVVAVAEVLADERAQLVESVDRAWQPCPPACQASPVAALLRMPAMADLLTTYAQLQPDKLAVVDDRPASTCARLTFAEFEDVRPTSWPTCCAEHGARPGVKVVVVRAELDRRRHPGRRRPQGRRDRGAGELPALRRGGGVRHRPQRRRRRVRRRRARPAVRAGPRTDPEGRARSSCSTVRRRPAWTSADELDRRSAAAPTRAGGAGRRGPGRR